MGILPEHAAIPVEWRTQDLWLRVLRPDVTELDFAALMESRERLRLWSDSTWPSDDFTLQENERDLIEHEREWEDREAFAYTVLNSDGRRCEGCVYVTPFASSMRHRGYDPIAQGTPFAEDAAAVSFWVRDSALARDLDRQLLAGLREWFQTEWPLSQVIYRINDNQHHDRQLFEEAGLVHRASHGTSRSPLIWHLYTEP
ncbi:MAG TPA: hypothetical protein VFV93_10420 [Thermomicrobiales bacterium]|nr:hypothetical protein [Thermomicrobiales bacterium]